MAASVSDGMQAKKTDEQSKGKTQGYLALPPKERKQVASMYN